MSVQVISRDVSQGTNAAPVEYLRAGYEASFGRHPIEDSALSEKDAIMSQSRAAENLIASSAPKRVELTDRVLFDDVWERKQSSNRHRSLVTVAALIA